MKLSSKLTLKSKIFKKGERDTMEKAVQKAAKTLHKRIRDKILKSPKRTGNVYLIKMPSGRVKKHVASARGEPPAILTRNLLNSIKLVKLGRYTWRIKVDAPYAIYLDKDEYLGRYFFERVVDEFRSEYLSIVTKDFDIIIEDR